METEEFRQMLLEALRDGLEIYTSEHTGWGPTSELQIEVHFGGEVVASDRFDLTNIDYPPENGE